MIGHKFVIKSISVFCQTFENKTNFRMRKKSIFMGARRKKNVKISHKNNVFPI